MTELKEVLECQSIQNLLKIARNNTDILDALLNGGLEQEDILNFINNVKVLVECIDDAENLLIDVDHDVIKQCLNPILHFAFEWSTRDFRDIVRNIQSEIVEIETSQRLQSHTLPDDNSLSRASSYWRRIARQIDNEHLVINLRHLKSALELAKIRKQEHLNNTKVLIDYPNFSHQSLETSFGPFRPAFRDIIKQIDQKFAGPIESGMLRKAVLHGSSEIGMKTTLALYYCEGFRKTYPDVPVFWVDAKSSACFEYNYYMLHQSAITVDGRDQQDDAPSWINVPSLTDLQSVKRWLEEDVSTFLLVIDGLDDVSNVRRTPINRSVGFGLGFSEHGYCLLDFLPKSSRGKLLFTTSSPRVADTIADATDVIQVGLPRSLDDVDLGSLPSPSDPDIPDDDFLTKNLRLFPHAMMISNCMMKHFKMPAHEYIWNLQANVSFLAKTSVTPFSDPEDDPLYLRVIAPVVTINFCYLRQNDTIAADILAHMACFERSAVPIDSITLRIFRGRLSSVFNMDNVPSAEEFNSALDLLVKCSWIYPNHRKTHYTMHRQTQKALREALMRKGELRDFITMGSFFITYRIDNGDMLKKDIWGIRLPYLLHVLELDRLRRLVCPDDTAPGCIYLCFTLTTLYMVIGHLQNEIYFRREWVRLCELRDGQEDRWVIQNKFKLAYLLFRADSKSEAKTICEKNLEVSKKILGEKDVESLGGMKIFAMCLAEANKHAEAEVILRDVIEAMIAQVGENDDELIATQQTLVHVLSAQERFQECEGLQRRIVQRRRVIFEHGSHTDQSLQLALGSLAVILVGLRRYDEAEQCEREVIDLNERYHCPDYPYVLQCQSNLAAILMQQERYWEAENMMLAVLKERKRILGVKNFGTLFTMANLARVRYFQGKHVDAIKLMIEVIAKAEDVVGKEHLTVKEWQEKLNAWGTLLELAIERGEDVK